MHRRLLSCLLWGVVCAASLDRVSPAAEQPNIILIMVDDFGYECVGANGGTSYKTPNLDKLAATGMRFEHCYVQPLCTPTRVQLMTGQSNVRNYVRFGLLPEGEITFGQLLKQAGYATSIVGKWQLGHGFAGPGMFGFDDYCLWQLTRRPPRYANPGLEINGKQVDYKNGEYGPHLVHQHALEFIAKNNRQPFFLYYPMMLTHGPFQPTPDSASWDPKAIGEEVNNNKAHFADMVAYMDKQIGTLVARLDELGLREKTLILFLGDNGTGRPITSKMGELSVEGGKGTLTDNGTRVALIANWPKTIPPGRVCNDLIDSTDFLPTICAAGGASTPAQRTLDGRSFLPQLKGETGQPREWLYCWYSPNQANKQDAPREFARDHRYKLFRDGSLFELDSQRFSEKKLDPASLSSEAATANMKLQAVLDAYQHARPQKLSRK